MERSFHMYVTSRIVKGYFKKNTSTDFYIQLPETVRLSGKGWYCALLQCRANISNTYYLCCDICDTSIVDNMRLPVLRQISRRTAHFEKLIYVPVIRSEFNTIHIYILNGEGELVSVIPGTVSCVLRFRQCSQNDATST